MKHSATLILTVVISFSTVAQTDFQRAFPHAPDSNTAAIRFERNVNTYLWNANAAYSYTDSDLLLNVGNAFTSSFIAGQFRSFRDEQNFSLNAIKRITSPISLAIEAQSFVLSDNQTLGNSNAGIHSGALGVLFQPAANISVTPLLGMRIDKQQREQDEGLNYRLHTIVDSVEFSGYRSEFSGHINQSDLGKRQFKNDTAKLYIATEFSPGSIDSVHVRWLLNRNDFYIPTDTAVMRTFGVQSNIRSRNEQLWGVQNILAYDIGDGFGTQFVVNVESRKISNAFRYKVLSILSSIPFNTTVQEMRIEGGVNLEYRSYATTASIGFHMSERDEKHRVEKIEGVDNVFQEKRSQQESRLDNTAFRNTVSANMFTGISSNDDLSFLGSVSLLKYDTPDTTNTDDRDELLITLSLREIHRFSSVFSAAFTTEATLAHLVYISRNKSASNNWNRIFRLSPELTYRPSENFRMFNSFEVLANYTIFDFESLIPTVKSYSYRQVAFLDTTSYDMTKRVGIDLFLNVRVFERGELRWKEFSERPLQRVEEVTFSPQIRYSLHEQWYFAIGFRSFAQKRFKYVNNIRQFENTFLSAGPTTNIGMRLSSQSLIEIRGWKEFQRQSGGRVQEFSNMTMNIRYYF